MNTLACLKHSSYTTSESHSHSNVYEIELIISGSETAVIGGKTYNLEGKDVVIIPPEIMHQETPEKSFSAIALIAKDLPFKDVTIVHDNDNSILTLFELLHKVMTEKDETYANIADSLTDMICLFIKKNMSYKHTFTAELQNKLYENISNPDFSISDEILRMGFNLDYFRRCFKEDYNMTPHDYLTNMRIDLAKKVMRANLRLSIEEVSFIAGFNDSFYFSKVFKKHTGLTPRDYRKKHLA